MTTTLIKVTEATPIVWANSGDYSNAVSGLARTHQIDLTGIAAGAARQGVKVDFGVTRFENYIVSAAIEFASSAVSGKEVEIFHAGSPSGTVGNANPGGTTGADADYTGTAGDSLVDSLRQLQRIGSLVVTSDNTTVVQYQVVGVISGLEMLRYGMPVAYFNTTAAGHTDAVEMFIAYTGIGPHIQEPV